jgi:hypothetical protein
VLGQRSAGVVFFVIGVLSASTRSADACSTVCTNPPVRLFPPVAEVPGNLVYFKLLVKEPGPLALTTEKGEPIAASVRRIGTDEVFAPERPVAAGKRLVFHYQHRCMGKLVEGAHKFVTGPTVKPELRPAELQVVEQGTRYPGDPRNESRFYRLHYYSPDAGPGVTHLLETTAALDGRPLELAETYPQQPLVFIESRCSAESPDEWGVDTCGVVRSVPNGARTLTVTSHIIGMVAPVNAVSMPLVFDCGAASAFRTGARPSASATHPTPAPSTHPTPAPSTHPSKRPRAISCGLDAGRPPLFPANLVALLALLAFRRARRRTS